MPDGIIYTGDLQLYGLDRVFDNLIDKSYLNVDYRSNGDMLRIITHVPMFKFQLMIGVFSVAFMMSVIEKFTEFRLFYFHNNIIY